MTRLMVTNTFIRLRTGAKRDATVSGKWRNDAGGRIWPSKARLFAPAGAALRSTCGQQDHGVDRALPAEDKKPVKPAKDYFLWYYCRARPGLGVAYLSLFRASYKKNTAYYFGIFFAPSDSSLSLSTLIIWALRREVAGRERQSESSPILLQKRVESKNFKF